MVPHRDPAAAAAIPRAGRSNRPVVSQFARPNFLGSRSRPAVPLSLGRGGICDTILQHLQTRGPKVGALPIPSLREEQYPAARRIFRDSIPETYAKWRYERVKEIAEEQGAGQTPVEVPLDIDTILKLLPTTNPNYATHVLWQIAYKVMEQQHVAT